MGKCIERMPTGAATTTAGGLIAWTDADGSALDAASVTHSNGNLNAQSGSFAKVTLANGESARIDLTYNGAFSGGEEPLPSDATLVAIDPIIHLLELGNGSATGAVYATVQLLVGGSATGDDRSDGRTIRRAANANDVFTQRIPDRFGTRDATTGDINDLWNLGVAATAANVRANGFGVRIEVTNSSGSSVTIGLDTVVMRVIYEKPLEAVIDDNGTEFEVYDQVNLSSLNSHFGSYRPEECSIEWTFDFPSGFTWEATDKRGGVHQQDVTRNLKGMTLKGFVLAYVPTVAGTYTTTLTVRLPDGTTDTATHVATVTAWSGDTLYVDTGGNNSNPGTQGSPKQTIDGAMSAATGPTIIYIKGGQTHTWAGGSYSKNGIKVLPWPGTGTPTISVTSQVTHTADQVLLGGFTLTSTLDPLTAPFSLRGTWATLIDITAPDVHRIADLAQGATLRGGLAHNVTATTDTYMFFNSAVRFVQVGTYGTADGGGGNGFTRTSGPNGSTQSGLGWSMYFCSGDCNNTSLNAFRSNGAYVSSFACRVDDGNLAFERYDSGNPFIRMAHTYMIDGYYQPQANKDGNPTTFAVPFVCVQNSIINGVYATTNSTRAILFNNPHSERWVVRHCTIGNLRLFGDGVVRVTGAAIAKQGDLINNLFFGDPEPEGGAWFTSNWYFESASSGGPSLREARGNVYGWSITAQLPGTRYTDLATWNGLDFVSGEAVDDDPRLEFADLSPSDDFVPPANHLGRTNGAPVEGVWADYRLTPRDHNASTWYVGATGGEAYVDPDGSEADAPVFRGRRRGRGRMRGLLR